MAVLREQICVEAAEILIGIDFYVCPVIRQLELPRALIDPHLHGAVHVTYAHWQQGTFAPKLFSGPGFKLHRPLLA